MSVRSRVTVGGRASRPWAAPVRRRAHGLFARVVLALAPLAALAVVPTAALAHGALKSSLPAAGAHLAAAPTELSLTFTEAPELTFTRVALTGPGGTAIALAPLRTAPGSSRTVLTAIRGSLVAGTYTVAWQTAGADGHPVRGRFSFVIAPGAQGLGAAGTPPLAGDTVRGEAAAGVPAPGQAPAPAGHHDPVSTPEGPGFDAESPAYVAIRWATYAALMLVLGAVAFNALVLGFLRRKQNPDSPMLAPASARAAQVGWWAALALAVVALLRLFAQSYALHGAADALNPGLAGAMLSRTVWGWGWLLQALGAVVAALGFRSAQRGGRAGWAIAAVGALLLAFTPALSGHAASAPRLTALAILADGAHVIGAGGWLGSLLVVVAVGVPAAMRLAESERGRAVADLINAFSPTALAFAGLVAATGVFAAWLHLGAVSALWQTTYGKTLLLKLAILSVVAGTGAYNWLRVRPALGDAVGAQRIRRSAGVELVVGVAVLVVTAVLVATPTAMDADSMVQMGQAAPPAPRLP